MTTHFSFLRPLAILPQKESGGSAMALYKSTPHSTPLTEASEVAAAAAAKSKIVLYLSEDCQVGHRSLQISCCTVESLYATK